MPLISDVLIGLLFMVMVAGFILAAVAYCPMKQPAVGWRVRDGKTDRPLSETDEYKLFQTVGIKDTCPDCGHKGFYEGPSGGLSTNIFCMNPDCRSGFNLTRFDAHNGTCDRIGKGDLARYPQDKSHDRDDQTYH